VLSEKKKRLNCLSGEIADFILNSLVLFDGYFLGEWAANSVGTNFTPHVITVNAGEVCLTEDRQILTYIWIMLIWKLFALSIFYLINFYMACELK
jgi:hypothetical protein